MRNIALRAFLLAAATAVVIGSWIGARLDPAGFVGNLLSEGVGLAASLVVGLVLVERLVERDRRRRWELVAAETETALRFAIVRIAREIYLEIPAPRPGAADPLSMADAGALSQGLSRLEEVLNMPSTGWPQQGDVSAIVGAIRPQVGRIRNDVTLRLLTLGQRPGLVAHLSAAEGAFEELEFEVHRGARSNLGTRDVVSAAASLIGALRTVIDFIERDWVIDVEAERCPHSGCRHPGWPWIAKPRNWPWADECWNCKGELCKGELRV